MEPDEMQEMGADFEEKKKQQPRESLSILDDILKHDGPIDVKIQEHYLKKDTSNVFTKSHYTCYRIVGNDSIGEIDIERRYREFRYFRQLLFDRYPGLYIPQVPEKQF